MNRLNLYPTDPVDELVFPNIATDFSPASSALEVFTDFNVAKPMVIDKSATVAHANEVMLSSHVRLVLVVENTDHFVGVVSLNDIGQQNIVIKVSGGHRRDELTVKDFMRSRDSLKAFSYEELATASIGDIVSTLEDSGQQHCLVIDRDNHRIRGIVSASDIARKLHLPINLSKKATFADIFDTVYQQMNVEKSVTGVH